MNLSQAVPKPNHKRNKPLARNRGAISNKVRKQLAYRSQCACERCKRKESYSVVLEAAHTTRRWKIEGRTTVNQLAHLCKACHTWADNTAQGREWLTAFQIRLIEAEEMK